MDVHPAFSAYPRVYTCIYIYMCVCVSMCIFMYIYIWLNVYIHTYMADRRFRIRDLCFIMFFSSHVPHDICLLDHMCLGCAPRHMFASLHVHKWDTHVHNDTRFLHYMCTKAHVCFITCAQSHVFVFTTCAHWHICLITCAHWHICLITCAQMRHTCAQSHVFLFITCAPWRMFVASYAT